jgi:serpin B
MGAVEEGGDLRAPRGHHRENFMGSTKRSFLIVAALTAIGAPLAAREAYRGACSVVPMAKSELARETHPPVEASDQEDLVDGNARFAVDAFKALAAKDPQKNLLFSPYSISIALAMTLAGAGGQTESEMAATMHWTLPQERLHRTFNALDEKLASRQKDGVVLQFADSLWALPQVRFEKPFLDTMARSYGTGVRLTDFAHDPEGSRRRINGWVDDATHRKIPELLSKDTPLEQTSIALLNAVYFQAEWYEPFKREDTRSEPFWSAQGRTTSASMMNGEPRWARCTRNDAYEAIELRYAGEHMAMDIVMPKVESLAAFESGLTAETLGAVLHEMQPALVTVSMPRFRFAGPTFSLTKILEGLGMRQAFDREAADFSPMGTAPGGGLYIRDVLHQATIAVDEKGTEAAAGTAVLAGTGAAPKQEAVRIRIDHPFLFVLRDLSTGTLLFAGRVVDPGQDPPRE